MTNLENKVFKEVLSYFEYDKAPPLESSLTTLIYLSVKKLVDKKINEKSDIAGLIKSEFSSLKETSSDFSSEENFRVLVNTSYMAKVCTKGKQGNFIPKEVIFDATRKANHEIYIGVNK